MKDTFSTIKKKRGEKMSTGEEVTQEVYSMVDKARKYDDLLHLQKSPDDKLYCSFCHRSQYEVDQLITAEDGVAICNNCVQECVQVIKQKKNKKKWFQK